MSVRLGNVTWGERTVETEYHYVSFLLTPPPVVTGILTPPPRTAEANSSLIGENSLARAVTPSIISHIHYGMGELNQ